MGQASMHAPQRTQAIAGRFALSFSTTIPDMPFTIGASRVTADLPIIGPPITTRDRREALPGWRTVACLWLQCNCAVRFPVYCRLL